MITFIESGNRIATENFEIGEIYTITFTNGNYKTMCCVGIGSDFVMFQDKLPNALFCLTLGTSDTVSTIELGGGGSGTMNYNELENKPQINGIVLIGNKTSSDLGLLSESDLDNYVTDTELTAELAHYATNASVVSALASKQNELTTTQLNAVNSGITSTDVTQITTNKNNILSVANTGRKNMLHFNNNSTSSAAGVVYTINSDGSITADVSGKTGLSYIILMLDSSNVDVKPYCTGNYILTGCPSGGGDNTFQMYAASGSYVKRDYGDGVVLEETEQANVYLIIRIESAYSGGNVTFKPMIRIVGTDSTFEKWAPSNAELYDMILAL